MIPVFLLLKLQINFKLEQSFDVILDISLSRDILSTFLSTQNSEAGDKTLLSYITFQSPLREFLLNFSLPLIPHHRGNPSPRHQKTRSFQTQASINHCRSRSCHVAPPVGFRYEIPIYESINTSGGHGPVIRITLPL